MISIIFIDFFENKLNRCLNNLMNDFNIDYKFDNFINKNKKIALIVRNFKN